jgi:hypothetical protein
MEYGLCQSSWACRAWRLLQRAESVYKIACFVNLLFFLRSGRYVFLDCCNPVCFWFPLAFFSTGFLSGSKLIFWLLISQISQHSGTTAASTISVPKTPNGPSCELWVYESATCLAWVLSKSIYFLNGLSFYFRTFHLGWPSLGHNMTKSECLVFQQFELSKQLWKLGMDSSLPKK